MERELSSEELKKLTSGFVKLVVNKDLSVEINPEDFGEIGFALSSSGKALFWSMKEGNYLVKDLSEDNKEKNQIKEILDSLVHPALGKRNTKVKDWVINHGG